MRKSKKGKLGLANGKAKSGAVRRGVSKPVAAPKLLPVKNTRDQIKALASRMMD